MNLLTKSYLVQIKRYRKYNQVEKSAYELKKYYEYFNEGKDINQAFTDTFNVESYSDKEKKEILNYTTKLLNIKYNLKNISESFLILEKVNIDSK